MLGYSFGFTGAKVGIIGILSIVLYMSGGAALGHSPGTFEFALLAGREVAIGLFLAMILHLVILAVRVAGVMVGHEMSFNMSEFGGPQLGNFLAGHRALLRDHVPAHVAGGGRPTCGWCGPCMLPTSVRR